MNDDDNFSNEKTNMSTIKTIIIHIPNNKNSIEKNPQQHTNDTEQSETKTSANLSEMVRFLKNPRIAMHNNNESYLRKII